MLSKSPLVTFFVGIYLFQVVFPFCVSSPLVSVEAAVAAYSQARAPGIYKGDYLKELFRRYGDVEDAPAAPPLPEWCFDDDDGDVDDDGNVIGQESGPSSSGSAPGKRKKERLKMVREGSTGTGSRKEEAGRRKQEGGCSSIGSAPYDIKPLQCAMWGLL